jgi:nucleoside-diphosphate-sugar epimerase
MNNDSKPKLIISGATGWLGKEVLALLESKNSGQFSYEVVPISSNERILETPSGNKLITKTYENFETLQNVEGFINLAFLTREKVSEIGYENYVLRNLEMISHACQVIESCKPKWVVLVSSGAIFKNRSDELETSITDNPYGFLKRIEELLISETASRVGANVVIGRLWGASGRHMPINRAYALSDFICQAVEGGVIQIRSGHKVFRRFCDAAEFMDLLISLAQEGRSQIFNSGGPLIEIGELASGIATYFKGVDVIRSPATFGPDDNYYPRSKEFEELAQELAVVLSPISEQVKRTLTGHSSQLNM